MSKEVQIKVIFPSYKCEKWVAKNLASIEPQGYPHVELCVINDASPCEGAA